MLRAFARRCALDVSDRWDPPEIVLRYLKTGDPQLRAQARSLASRAALSSWNRGARPSVPDAIRATVRAAYGPKSTATPFRAARVVAYKARLAKPNLGARSKQERILGDMLVQAAIDRNLAPAQLVFARELLITVGVPLGLAQLARLSEEEHQAAMVWADAVQSGREDPRPACLYLESPETTHGH